LAGRQASTLVRQRWPAVRALAKVLQERNELDGEEVEAIVAAASKPTPCKLPRAAAAPATDQHSPR